MKCLLKYFNFNCFTKSSSAYKINCFFIRECLFFEKVETVEAIICLALLVLLQDRLHYLNISYSDEGKYGFVNSVNFDTRQRRMVSFTNSPLYLPAREHQNPLNTRLAVPQGCYLFFYLYKIRSFE